MIDKEECEHLEIVDISRADDDYEGVVRWQCAHCGKIWKEELPQ